MRYWIQECPHCGYISGALSDETSISNEYLKSEEYIKCNNANLPTDLAKGFYKYYLLNMKEENPKDAFLAALHTAWICDDKSDESNAYNCRLLALEQLEIILKEDAPEVHWVVKADLLRRTGQFDRLITEYGDKEFEDNLLNEIVSFEIARAKEKDTSCYRVADVKATEK